MTEPRRKERVDAAWFERLYAKDPNPWRFATSDYERRKYELTVACLPRRRYRAGFEPGCSIGELSRLLAPLCDRLLATDIVASVVERAAAALRGLPGVRVEQRAIPEGWPEGTFDLVVLSEVGYYLTGGELDEVIAAANRSLEPGGHLLAVHWTGVTDYPLDGSDVHARIGRSESLRLAVRHDEAEFELRCWERR